MPELEKIIEEKLIEQLVYGESQWTYRDDLKTEADLWKNFKYILEQNNKDRLNGEPLSDTEFEQVKNQLQFSSFYKAGEWLVGENGKVQVHVQRDTERLHLVVMNHEHIAGGSSVYEVINQYSALGDSESSSVSSRDRRFDVTLMINGLPMIHIELKNKQHSYMDAFWQIKKYIGEGKFTGIFSAVQMFVVSNGVDTKYFAAASDTELNPKFMSGWVDQENNPVPDYIDFAKSVLRIPEAHEMIARYTVLDEDAKRLILLRPYQIHAIESIREASKTGKSGYVWHTTGSGKTLTSYKATRNLLMDIPAIDKAIFLIDRKDLDTQTTMAFQAYANNDLVDVDETDNVNDLKKKLKSDDRQVIVTTIQKMQILISKRLKEGTPEYSKIKNLKIKSHLEKEEELFNRGIKTLSLFFIDEVAKYRRYDEDGEELLGEYGEIFEREYNDIVNEYMTDSDTPYQKYLKSIEVKDTHKGYFSIDKKGHVVDSKVKRNSDSSDDTSAYDLILKNKERLLSFEEPTRFIFSHSALREGWDNPNVFQICTLKYSDSTTGKRQEVGRGLRLCVDQNGFRMDEQSVGKSLVHKINKLTVIASESYRDFVTDLQKQIKTDLYDRPRKATIDYFTGKTIMVNGNAEKLKKQQATMIYQYLVKNDYVTMDGNDNITDQYYSDLQNNHLAPLPEPLAAYTEGIHKLIQSVFNEKILDDMIDNGNESEVQDNDLNDNFYKNEFQTLWEYINHKYSYTVSFDSKELIKKSIEAIDAELYVSMLQYTTAISEQKDTLSAEGIKAGDSFKGVKSNTTTLKHFETGQVKYDLIGKVAEATVLTRRTVAAILRGIRKDKFDMYQNNPEEFIVKVTRFIKEQKAMLIVDNISYVQLEDKYDSGIFTAQKRTAINKAFRAEKHIQPYVFTDGNAAKSVERQFAEALDGAAEVCAYAKLPKTYVIPTPVGNYSPDWAIAFKEGTVKHVFVVAETKGTMESLQLRPIEQAKIMCARKLFNEISTENVVYHDVDSYQSLLNILYHQ